VIDRLGVSPMNKIIQALAVVLFVSFSVTPFLVPHINATEDSWTTMESMPTARRGLGVAVVDGKIYAIGGFTSNYLGTNEMYDPETDTWTTKASMPNPRCRFAIAVVENKIYVIGGANPNGFSSVNQVYDPATDTWETLTSMPSSRAELCASVIDGKICVIGGGDLVSYDLNQIYDPATDTWTTGTAMPTPRQSLGVAVLNDTLYAIGGYQTDSSPVYTSKNERYTPSGYIPEFPTWTPILLMLGIVAVAVVIYKRKLCKNQGRQK